MENLLLALAAIGVVVTLAGATSMIATIALNILGDEDDEDANDEEGQVR